MIQFETSDRNGPAQPSGIKAVGEKIETWTKDAYEYDGSGYITSIAFTHEGWRGLNRDRTAPSSAYPDDQQGVNSGCEFDYMHARYYSPTLARFVSVDPVGGV